ncbi:MAG: tyrosine-type recombinase/integrase [Spirochaetes bacterium]|nr:tyrosine-type recombinase/integrase [Spirochaetota bacterium]
MGKKDDKIPVIRAADIRVQKKSPFRNKALSKNSIITYSAAVKGFDKFVKDIHADYNVVTIDQWLKKYRNPNTYNLKLQALKEYILKQYEDEPPEVKMKLVEALESIKRRKPQKAVMEDDYLSIEKVEELASLAKPLTACFILALFWTGCRVSELTNIKIIDCRANGKVSIRIRQGKGNKEREVYMPRTVYDRIREEFQGKEYLFETRAGTPYHRRNVSKTIAKEAREKMELDISAHTLRHSKAMYLKNVRGLSADQIAKALGHSSPLTTLQHYFHGTPTAEEQGIE